MAVIKFTNVIYGGGGDTILTKAVIYDCAPVYRRIILILTV
jgi:hypothetical protein